VVRINPQAGPAGERATAGERWQALRDIWPVAVVFLLVMGGIYTGFFTPSEAAGVGTVGTFLIAVTRGSMRLRGFFDVLLETALTTGMIFLILLGAAVFNAFLGFSELTQYAARLFGTSGMPPLGVLLAMVVLFVLLGMVMDSLSMILLTVPIILPTIKQLGIHPIVFGILVIRMVEIGLMTPPVGLNVYVLKGVAPNVSMGDIFRGCGWFVFVDIINVAILLAFPLIILLIPMTMIK